MMAILMLMAHAELVALEIMIAAMERNVLQVRVTAIMMDNVGMD